MRSHPGACPACGRPGLWVDERGDVRCAWDRCPGPDPAATAAAEAERKALPRPKLALAELPILGAPASSPAGRPPLGEHAPPFTCGRLTASGHCGRDGAFHVIWDATVENAIACTAHMREIEASWPYLAAHPYSVDCSMPGAAFDEAANACRVDEFALGLEEP